MRKPLGAETGGLLDGQSQPWLQYKTLYQKHITIIDKNLIKIHILCQIITYNTKVTFFIVNLLFIYYFSYLLY